MRPVIIALAGVFVLPYSLAALTMEEAVSVAVTSNAEVRAAEGELAVAKGRARGASLWLQDNPTVEAAGGPRDPSGERTVDYSVALTQGLDLVGQRGARIDAASALVLAAEARAGARRAQVAADTREAFGRVLAGEASRKLAEEAREVADQALEAAEERHDAGDASLIELNTARVEAGRAVREQVLALQREQQARAELKLLTNAEPSTNLTVDGELVEVVASRPTITIAHAERFEVVAARYDLEAAKSAERLAAREAIPRPRVGAAYARDEGVPVIQALVSVELPIFNRNDAARAEARARVTQAESALRAAERRAMQDAELARSRYAAAERALLGYEGPVVKAASENVELATEGYRDGKLSFLELLVIRRGSLEVRQGYIEALQELNAAHAALRRAAGQ